MFIREVLEIQPEHRDKDAKVRVFECEQVVSGHVCEQSTLRTYMGMETKKVVTRVTFMWFLGRDDLNIGQLTGM